MATEEKLLSLGASTSTADVMLMSVSFSLLLSRTVRMDAVKADLAAESLRNDAAVMPCRF